MPLQVTLMQRPPERLEGGGFKIRDIMDEIPHKLLDPFLIWHELPREFQRPGDFPGAPRHPHRGFMECPYMREITAETGTATSTSTVWAGGKSNTVKSEPGGFELGKVGIGMEHELVNDKQWSGFLHGFQLWVNLPEKHKFDAPHFQNAAPSALPVVDLGDGATARVMHGELKDAKSPTECEVVQWQYFDMEVPPGGSLNYEPPAPMTTRLIYVYRGNVKVQGKTVPTSTVACLEGDGVFEAVAGAEGVGFLWIAGAPLGEKPYQHGPFVMSNRQQIAECFQDFQMGKLAPKAATHVEYK